MTWSPSKVNITVEAPSQRQRAWDRQPRTGVDKYGKQRTIYKRYNTRRASSTSQIEVPQQSPQQSPKKIVKKLRVVGQPSNTPTKSRKGSGVAARFDRRKSTLPHKEPIFVLPDNADSSAPGKGHPSPATIEPSLGENPASGSTSASDVGENEEQDLLYAIEEKSRISPEMGATYVPESDAEYLAADGHSTRDHVESLEASQAHVIEDIEHIPHHTSPTTAVESHSPPEEENANAKEPAEMQVSSLSTSALDYDDDMQSVTSTPAAPDDHVVPQEDVERGSAEAQAESPNLPEEEVQVSQDSVAPNGRSQPTDNTLSAIDINVMSEELSNIANKKDDRETVAQSLVDSIDTIMASDEPIESSIKDDLILDLDSFLSRSQPQEAHDDDAQTEHATVKQQEEVVPLLAPKDNRTGETRFVEAAEIPQAGPSPSLQQTSPRTSDHSASPPVEETTTTITINLNDDEELLRSFLNRSKASKAARIARRTSESHRRDSGVVKQALASPHRKALDDLDTNSPSPTKKRFLAEEDDTLTVTDAALLSIANADAQMPSNLGDDDELTLDMQTLPATRRSNRRATPRKSMTLQTPASLLRRSTEATGSNDTVTLKRSEAQELANSTRSNTRKNKGPSLPVRSMLVKLKKEDDSLDVVVSEQRATKNKAVTWNEELVSFFKEPPNGHAPEQPTEPASQSQPKPDPPPQPQPPTKPRPARRAKTLGATNGTPAPAPAKSRKQDPPPPPPPAQPPTPSAKAAKELVTSVVETKQLQQQLQTKQQELIQAQAQAGLAKPARLFVGASGALGGGGRGTGAKEGKLPAPPAPPPPPPRSIAGVSKKTEDTEKNLSQRQNGGSGDAAAAQDPEAEAKAKAQAKAKTRRSTLPRYATRART
ncbi:MAG: hypothetical protein M1828_001300 [Chrysothrix sp. TS-e1954]|nr:MAG: hypothetical protein M1828_001300 [Chrysothrix sp. TS-e1954]